MTAWLTGIGFDVARMRFALVTAAAACLALLISWSVGLEHPQWSAMAVWAASLPVRGHLLDKSFARFGGTVIGAIYGMGLMVLSGGHPALLVAGLALWVGGCAFAGNIFRAFGSYAAMLSGYSASMVVLLDSAHPDHVLAIGIDRMLTVGVGVLAALVIGWLFASPVDDMMPVHQARLLTRRILADMAGKLGKAASSDNEQMDLLGQMAALEGSLDLFSAGSLRRRQSARRIRVLLAALVDAFWWLQSATTAGDASSSGLVAVELEKAATHAGDNPSQCEAAMARAIEGLSPEDRVAQILTVLKAGYSGLDAPSDVRDVPLHRDWRGARQAMVRAMAAMLVVGAIWLGSGWQMGAFMLLGASIMLTVFSTFESPTAVLKHVFWGQAAGVIGALACRWLVWPLAHSQLELILLTMPFIVFGAFLTGHRGSQRIAFDYNMVMLLLLQPAWPQAVTLPYSLEMGLAVMAGPLAGIVAYHLVYPTSGKRRYDAIRIAMIDDLERLAASLAGANRSGDWKILFRNRVLLLVHWSARVAIPPEQRISDALRLLSIAGAMEQLAACLPLGSDTGSGRHIPLALSRIGRIGRDPAGVARRLSAAANRVSDRDAAMAGPLRQIVAAIDGREDLLRR